MKPYYEHGGITIYHGDCRSLLREISADVLITDPPYGMAYCSGWSGSWVIGDEDSDLRDGVLEDWRPRPAIVFGRWSVQKPFGTRIVLVWDKGEWPGMGDLKLPWGPSHEEIYVLGPTEAFVGVRSGSVLRAKRIGGSGEHPTEKHLGIMRLLVEKTKGILIDPFMGSGTTLVAAKNLGRKAIGIEIEERYCEIAAKRLGQEILPFPSVQSVAI